MSHVFLSCQVQTLSFYFLPYLLLSLSNPIFVCPPHSPPFSLLSWQSQYFDFKRAHYQRHKLQCFHLLVSRCTEFKLCYSNSCYTALCTEYVQFALTGAFLAPREASLPPSRQQTLLFLTVTTTLSCSGGFFHPPTITQQYSHPGKVIIAGRILEGSQHSFLCQGDSVFILATFHSADEFTRALHIPVMTSTNQTK